MAAKLRTERNGGLLTYAQVSQATGFSRATIGRLVRSGELGSVRFGPRSVRVPADVLQTFLVQGGIRDDRGDDA